MAEEVRALQQACVSKEGVRVFAELLVEKEEEPDDHQRKGGKEPHHHLTNYVERVVVEEVLEVATKMDLAAVVALVDYFKVMIGCACEISTTIATAQLA
eukprot:CAMPEP_0170497296 /NCGR_PEP_ID=MMETSP0208-20121228/24330_1 /TAXON_ID=197538 /ORGANISM="Strombidium inclinatum, Strain S3" /LENGTH=98 /DNA_ID=CAMNT_0010774071 /DNA_START=3257 /DNA_END=3553 /DNA_ORIENTATION=-